MHFLDYGMKEGRQGSASFDPALYRAKYTDVRNVYGDDMQKYYMHYLVNGVKEGRDADENKLDYSLVFDYDYYISRYKDVYNAYGDDKDAVLQHFIYFATHRR